MEKTIVCAQPEEMAGIAQEILSTYPNERFFIFHGGLGAGKTTLIKHLCAALNVIDNVNSPTFGLLNEYLTDSGDSIYHFDFYRINVEREAIDMGALEYFDSGDYCFVEWPEKVEGLLPDDYVVVDIETIPEGREVKFYKK